MTGYSHYAYAQSLAEFGSPRRLTHSGGSVIGRSIVGSESCDAMGCYPLFTCTNWAGLKEDLAELEQEFVCLSLVADPFADLPPESLGALFDQCRVFKEHFVIDLKTPPERIGTKHHRYYARRAARTVRVEISSEPQTLLDEWTELYGHLVKRHGLKGIKAFSRRCFEQQLKIPGLIYLRATTDGAAVGAHLWYVQGDVACSHLAAVNDAGYRLGASYAMYSEAIIHFREKLSIRWLNIGAGAGLESGSGGLTEFKRGWATSSIPARFCTRIFQPVEYERLVQLRNPPQTSYFPAYRHGEFG